MSEPRFRDKYALARSKTTSLDEYYARWFVNIKFSKEVDKANCGTPTYGIPESQALKNCRYWTVNPFCSVWRKNCRYYVECYRRVARAMAQIFGADLVERIVREDFLRSVLSMNQFRYYFGDLAYEKE